MDEKMVRRMLASNVQAVGRDIRFKWVGLANSSLEVTGGWQNRGLCVTVATCRIFWNGQVKEVFDKPKHAFAREPASCELTKLLVSCASMLAAC